MPAVCSFRPPIFHGGVRSGSEQWTSLTPVKGICSSGARSAHREPTFVVLGAGRSIPDGNGRHQAVRSLPGPAPAPGEAEILRSPLALGEPRGDEFFAGVHGLSELR